MSDSSPVIDLQGIGKRFSLRAGKAFLLRDTVMRLAGHKPDAKPFWALRDVSLDVKRGDSMAVIGRNGSGKSTLLGIIAGTIFPTEGRVQTRGRVSAMLELGVGFHPDLTGRENVYLNAALLGMSERDIRARFDAIVAFSEIEQFIDTPISKYSSGMVMRLGFAVAVNVDPEIMIIDEIFAVGDQSFQQKCTQRMEALRSRGTTFLVVSHSLTNVQWFCNRALWLDHGRVAASGPVEDVIAAYQRTMADAGWSMGARDHGNNWRSLGWFGTYMDLSSATPHWIWHQQHGNLYMSPDSNPDSIWIWTADKGWLWTRSTWYPYVLRQDDDTCYLYELGSQNPRRFMNVKTNTWEAW